LSCGNFSNLFWDLREFFMEKFSYKEKTKENISEARKVKTKEVFSEKNNLKKKGKKKILDELSTILKVKTI